MLLNISNDKLEFFSFHLQNKYFISTSPLALFLFPRNRDLFLFIKKDIFDNLDKRKSVMVEFMEFLSLIEFLKSERFIDISPNEEALDSELLVMKEDFDLLKNDTITGRVSLNSNGDYISTHQAHLIKNKESVTIFEGVKLPDHSYKQVVENCLGLIFVSEELKEFIRNGFKSKDDIRYRIGQYATWISISLALIFGIIGIYNPFKDNLEFNFKEAEEHLIQPITKRLDSVIYNQSTQSMMLDSLRKVNTKDTSLIN